MICREIDHDWSDTEGFIFCKTCGAIGLIEDVGDVSYGDYMQAEMRLSILEPEAVVRALKAAQAVSDGDEELLGRKYVEKDEGPFGELHWSLREIQF